MQLECSEPRAKIQYWWSGQMNRQTAVGTLNDTIIREGSSKEEWLRRTESNNSFNRSGISLLFIENLDAIRRYFPPG